MESFKGWKGCGSGVEKGQCPSSQLVLWNLLEIRQSFQFTTDITGDAFNFQLPKPTNQPHKPPKKKNPNKTPQTKLHLTT